MAAARDDTPAVRPSASMRLAIVALALAGCAHAQRDAPPARADEASRREPGCRTTSSGAGDWAIACAGAQAWIGDVELDGEALEAAWAEVAGVVGGGAADAEPHPLDLPGVAKGPVRFHRPDGAAGAAVITAAVLDMGAGRYRSISCTAAAVDASRCDALMRQIAEVPWGAGAILGVRREDSSSPVARRLARLSDRCDIVPEGTLWTVRCGEALAMLWLEGSSTDRLEDLSARALRLVERRFPIRARGTRSCKIAGVEASCTALVFERGQGTLYAATTSLDGTPAWIACFDDADGVAPARPHPCASLLDLLPASPEHRFSP